MEVVVDTSILRQKYPLRGPSARYLHAFAAHHDTSVIIPDVVVREMTRWIESEVRKAFNQIRQSAGTVRRFGISDALDVAGENAEDTAVKRALQDFCDSLQDLDAVVAPIPQGIAHEQVLDRLHSARKPFSGATGREKGYRDYLIWETILSLERTGSERDEDGRLPVAFLTANTKDFADEDKSLHPDLQQEAEQAGLSVTLYTTIDAFIGTVVGPALPTSTKVAALLKEDTAKLAIGDFISDEFSKSTSYEISATIHPYDAVIEEATIEAIDGVTVEYTKDVIDLSGDTAAAEVAVHAEASVSFFVFKADAYTWDDEPFASLSDWNDHYFRGEMEAPVEGTFRLELEVTDDGLQPVGLDVVEITLL